MGIRNHRVAIILSLGLISMLMNQLIIVNRQGYRKTLANNLLFEGSYNITSIKNSSTNSSSTFRNRSSSFLARDALPNNRSESLRVDVRNETMSVATVVTKNSSMVGDDGSSYGFSHSNHRDSKNDPPSTTTTKGFRWDYLDFDRQVFCGADKCLARSLSPSDGNGSSDANKGCGPGYETGYLISKDSKHDPSIGDGWKISQYLAAKFGIRHFLLEPPVETTLDRGTASKLFLVYPDGTQRSDYVREAYEVFNAKDNLGVVNTTVQKIRIAPTASRELRLKHPPGKLVYRLEELLHGPSDDGNTTTTTNITNNITASGSSANIATTRLTPEGELLDAARNNGTIQSGRNSSSSSNSSDYDLGPIFNATLPTPLATSCGTPLLRFLDKLHTEILDTRNLLLCEPLLALDFQVMVDAMGNLYHLDFDRVLSQLGGLKRYNQTRFDAKIRTKLEAASEVLDVVERWIDYHRSQYMRQQQQYQGKQQPPSRRLQNHSHFPTELQRRPNHTAAAATLSRRKLGPPRCRGDWEKEESVILASSTLPCLATERVAIARHATTSTMAADGNFIEEGLRRPEDRRRHPLLVALLRRVIEAGFYGSEADARGWDCNAYGDRVVVPTEPS